MQAKLGANIMLIPQICLVSTLSFLNILLSLLIKLKVMGLMLVQALTVPILSSSQSVSNSMDVISKKVSLIPSHLHILKSLYIHWETKSYHIKNKA